MSSNSGWDASAAAWIDHLGETGDRARQFVIDPRLETWLDQRHFTNALDVGCGEGRLCRRLARHGAATVGIDPTKALIERARLLDANGTYHAAYAEELPLQDRTFDLVVTCMSLIDIPDFRRAISEMNRVLAPGGTLLAINLTSFNSAGDGEGWRRNLSGAYTHFGLDNYLEERANTVYFAGIRVENWHRPLSAYMTAYLSEGLQLVSFEEPKAIGGPRGFASRYNRAPWINWMEWRKPS